MTEKSIIKKLESEIDVFDRAFKAETDGCRHCKRYIKKGVYCGTHENVRLLYNNQIAGIMRSIEIVQSTIKEQVDKLPTEVCVDGEKRIIMTKEELLEVFI